MSDGCPSCGETGGDTVSSRDCWEWMCRKDLAALEAERDRYKTALLEIRRMWFEETKFTVMKMAEVAIVALGTSEIKTCAHEWTDGGEDEHGPVDICRKCGIGGERARLQGCQKCGAPSGSLHAMNCKA